MAVSCHFHTSLVLGALTGGPHSDIWGNWSSSLIIQIINLNKTNLVKVVLDVNNLICCFNIFFFLPTLLLMDHKGDKTSFFFFFNPVLYIMSFKM